MRKQRINDNRLAGPSEEVNKGTKSVVWCDKNRATQLLDVGLCNEKESAKAQ